MIDLTKRPPDHMPYSPDDATVATLGDAVFKRKPIFGPCRWHDDSADLWISYDQLTRYGASFWGPVPTLPENTRELTEEEWSNPTYRSFFAGWKLGESGGWTLAPDNCSTPDEPWRCRVLIAQKVVAFSLHGIPSIRQDGDCYLASFDHEEDRDRAVKEANERANGREG